MPPNPYGFGWGGMGPGMGLNGSYWWGAPPGMTDLDLYDYNGNYVLDDEEIKDLVKDNIVADPGIPMSDAHRIDAQVQGGTVTLTGTVRHPRTNPLAYTDAYWTPGVREVIDNIQVEPLGQRMPVSPRSERPQK